MDEALWTCATCSPTGCTDDPESCIVTQCQLWDTTTNSPQSTKSSSFSSSSSQVSNTTDVDTILNTTSTSNAPDPPENLCIESNMFKNSVSVAGLTKMLFVLSTGYTQSYGGSRVYFYDWYAEWDSCWNLDIINNRWSIREYCDDKGSFKENITIGPYCVTNGGDYIPTVNKPVILLIVLNGVEMILKYQIKRMIVHFLIQNYFIWITLLLVMLVYVLLYYLCLYVNVVNGIFIAKMIHTMDYCWKHIQRY